MTVEGMAALAAALGLGDVTERIDMNGHPVAALELEWTLAEILDVAERIDVATTESEAMTLAGYLLLAEARVDVPVVEVGPLRGPLSDLP
jgi:folylpolyglutamate synthase/dihydropteroate synthase